MKRSECQDHQPEAPMTRKAAQEEASAIIECEGKTDHFTKKEYSKEHAILVDRLVRGLCRECGRKGGK